MGATAGPLKCRQSAREGGAKLTSRGPHGRPVLFTAEAKIRGNYSSVVTYIADKNIHILKNFSVCYFYITIFILENERNKYFKYFK